MKRKNKILTILSVFLITISLIILMPRVGADSGWDGGYDSGGSSWDGGSSDWGGSSSWGSSGSSSWSSSSSGDVDGSFIMFIIFLAIVYTIIVNLKKKGVIASVHHKGINYDAKPYPIEKIKEVLPNFDEEQFKQQAYDIYKDVQEAWMEFDYDAMRKLTTDELFNMYHTQLTALKIKKQKNIMLDFELHNVDITGMEVTAENVSLKVAMYVSCYDYVVNKENLTVRGTDKVKMNYYYEMTFIKGISEETNKCPNCNAPLENTNSSKCPYCGSVVVSDNHDWVLAKKQMKQQSR